MESQRYHYCVLRLNDEHTTLTAGDIFKFSIRVSFYSIDTDRQRLLYYSPSQSIPCHNFFQEGQDFLRTLLSRIHSFMQSPEEIIDSVISATRELFDDVIASPPPSLKSQQREIPLNVVIILFDNHLHAAMEESMQYFRMIPASNKAIQTLLKKSTVKAQSECCAICLEGLNINPGGYKMPCDHVFHKQCIVAWLQTSHVCPLCRYPLPTLRD